MKRIIKLLICVLILFGCNQNQVFNQPRVIITDEKINNDIYKEFINIKFDSIAHYKLDHLNFDVSKIEVNHYKNGKKIDRLFLFKRELNDKNIADIQYISLGYRLNENNMTLNLYMYGPKSVENGWEEYSVAIEKDDIPFNKLDSSIIKSDEIYNKEGVHYIQPLIFNDDEVKTLEELMNGDYEFIVLEVQ